MALAFPFQVDARGRSAEAVGDDRLRGMVEQVLFTSPGERVNRPDFGCGLLQLVFAPNSDALGAAVQMTVQGALQQWLGELIEVEAVKVDQQDGTLRVDVQYRVRRDQERRFETYTRRLG